MHPTEVLTAEKFLRRGGRPHMDLQRPHHRTATLVRRSSTTSRHQLSSHRPASMRLTHAVAAAISLPHVAFASVVGASAMARAMLIIGGT